MSWKDDKDLGSWEFSEQPNKWGYLNNPRWSNNPKNSADSMSAPEFCADRGLPVNLSNRHIPCGHWHKGESSTLYYITFQEGSWWQQSLDIGDDGNIYIGASNYDYNQMAGIKSDITSGVDTVQLVSEYVEDAVYDDGNPLIDGTQFESVSVLPPTIIRCSKYTVLVNLVWGLEDGDGDYTSAIVCGVKRDDEDQYWKVVVNKFGQEFKDGDIGDVDIAYSYSAVAFDNGTIVISYQYNDYDAGTDNLCVIRSTDYGVTWGSEIVVDDDVDYAGNMKMGDDGDIYISHLYGSGATAVGNIFISSDYGVTWTKKSTPATTSTPSNP